MKLSIITINYNNAEGLRKTLASVASQTYRNIEHIIVDGGSTDGSVDIIREYENTIKRSVTINQSTIQVKWVSEPDMGIYNAMNKGIEIALGRRIVNSFNRSELINDDHTSNIKHHTSLKEHHTSNIIHNTSQESLCDYVQILNSGDILAADDVTERMENALHSFIRSTLNDKIDVPILYGNMVKFDYTNNRILGKSGEVAYSLRQYYSNTMNHDCCYIRRDLFDTYGLYDENLKIVSDWKWFLQAIGLGKVKPVYVDIDVTIFDASGISETNLELRNKERRQVLEEVLPPAIFADYDKYAFPMEQYNRLKKYHLWPIAYFMERVLFKLNKWKILR